MRKSLQNWLLIGLAILLAAVGIGLWRTSGAANPDAGRRPTNQARTGDAVDQTPLQLATRLASLAEGAEEQQLAKEAMRLADHEVDLAFEQALRIAAQQQTSATGEALRLRTRVQQAQQQLTADDDRLAKLKQSLAAAKAEAKPDIERQVALAEAQRALDEDQAEDAQQDLARAGGDPQTRIQQLLDQHNAAQHSDQAAASAGAAMVGAGPSLISRMRLWMRLSGARGEILEAQRQAQTLAQSLAIEHAALEQATNDERAHKPPARAATKQTRQTPSAPQQAATPATAGPSLALLHRLSADQKNLAAYDKRIQDAQALGEVYGKWVALLEARRRAALHALLLSVAVILAIALAGVVLSWLVDRYFRKVALDRRRAHTFRSVLRLAAQLACVFAVLVVIFGPPTEVATMLGLLGAGLTVVLKDFIVSFFGWFVLMGRNGIRIGDWVEIEGVRGEVVEIGLLRTVLLETGNWTDQGRPTGRQVSFANSFAMENHYFNFSTASQWLWDELEVVIALHQDPYPLVERIHQMVAAETAENEGLAAEEWQRVRRSSAGPAISAAAAISLRPVREGIDLKVRYVTRASERYEFRSRLYSKILELLRQERSEKASTRDAATGS